MGELGKPDFEALVQDMVGAFYLAAAEEPVLQEPLKIGVLRSVAEEMGALKRLQRQKVTLARRSLGQLEPLYRNEQIFNRLAHLMQEDADAQVRDAAYGARRRLAAAPEERPA